MIAVAVAVPAVRRPSRPRRWRFRAVAWLSLAIVVPVLCACNARTLEPPDMIPEPGSRDTIILAANRNVDLLFLIDDSSSMSKSQDNLRRNFPAFMNALKALPGGLPNVHIAVVSSDMGAGDGSVSGCDATGGKNGIFQYTSPTCTTGLEPGATYISDIGGVRNYTGNLEDVFTCIAGLGEKGCGFEHQFAAITRALGADGQAPPLENQGFLRPEAYLAIVLITNEDDCSAPAGSPLYDTSSNTGLMSVLGPPSNFRCNEYGHICDGVHPSRFAPNNAVGDTKSYASCVSAEDGALVSVADTVARIRLLKPDPDNQVIVAAISGARAPYTVTWDNAPVSDSGPWPKIAHACMAGDGSFADPSPRIADFVAGFHGNGLQLSICDAEFAPALLTIADKIRERISKPCFTARIAKKRGTTSDDCTVVSSAPNGTGSIVERPIRACADTGGAGPCWRLAPGEGTCTGQTIDVVPDPAAPAPAWETAAVECSLCAPGVSDPARGCP